MNTPDWTIESWLNTPQPLSLQCFTNKVVVLEAFQMLCPGCVSHGLPQLKRIEHAFSSEDVAVVGLHSVFEHHEAQGNDAAIRAFAHENKLTFPVGIDAHTDDSPMPVTMRAYEMRGTPTMVLFDRMGNRRKQYFGTMPDLELGAEIMQLILLQT